MEYKTYKDLVEDERAADVCDDVYDMCVYIDYEPGSEDYFDQCLELICSELEIKDADIDHSIVTCNVTDWVRKHIDKLDEIFAIDAPDKDAKVEEFVCEMFESLVSGNATDKAYEQLYYALIDAPIPYTKQPDTKPENVVDHTVKVEEAKKDIGELVPTLKQKAYEILQSEEMGFPEDEAKEYTVVELKNGDDNSIIVEVRAELSYEGMDNLIDYLNPVLKGYDKESYFDMVEPGIAQAVIEGYTLPVVEETVEPIEDPMEEITESLVEEIVEEAEMSNEDIEEDKATISKERKAEIIAELFDWIDYHDLDAFEFLNVTEEDLDKSSSLELDEERMDDIISKGITCVDEHIHDMADKIIGFKDIIGLSDEEIKILEVPVELTEEQPLEESIKDTDFIIYRSTVEGPLYMSGLSTSFRKEDAVKYPTEEEAKEALHDYIENVVDPEANEFKVARLNESKIEEANTSIDLSMEIKPWYKKEHKEDGDFWKDIKDGVTFQDVQDALDKGEDVYEVFGVGDSVVRENIFQKLSELRNVDYDVIYNEWLHGGEQISEDELNALKTVFNNIVNKKVESKLVEDETSQEDLQEFAEEVEEAIEEIGPTDESEELAVNVVNDSVDVLEVDERMAINGYEDFLNAAKELLAPALYEVLEKEVKEIIADEEDHITILENIKATFHLDGIEIPGLPQEEIIEEPEIEVEATEEDQ